MTWLSATTPLQLHLVPGFPDYHPEHPGGKPRGGRSLEPDLFSFDRLGDWAGRVAGAPRPLLVTETPTGGGTGVLTPEVAQERAAAHVERLGRALVGALLRGCLDRGVEPGTGVRGTRLTTDDGHVTGVEVETDQNHITVGASAVVLATGGFGTTRTSSPPFCAARCGCPPGRRPTPATACGWPCGWARRSA